MMGVEVGVVGWVDGEFRLFIWDNNFTTYVFFSFPFPLLAQGDKGREQLEPLDDIYM